MCIVRYECCLNVHVDDIVPHFSTVAEPLMIQVEERILNFSCWSQNIAIDMVPQLPPPAWGGNISHLHCWFSLRSLQFPCWHRAGPSTRRAGDSKDKNRPFSYKCAWIETHIIQVTRKAEWRNRKKWNKMKRKIPEDAAPPQKTCRK